MMKRGRPWDRTIPQDLHIVQNVFQRCGSRVADLREDDAEVFVFVEMLGQCRGVAYGPTVFARGVDQGVALSLDEKTIASRNSRSSSVASLMSIGSTSKPMFAARAIWLRLLPIFAIWPIT